MPLKLDNANVVIVGKFNPYIFSPEWLREQEIWSHSPIQLALGAVSDGVRFHAADDSVAWQVDPNGLTITSREAASLAKRVLEKLPHTPLVAVGCNYSFSSEQWNAELVPKLGDMKLEHLPVRFHPELTSWSGVFHVEDVRIQMTVATGREGVTVTFNHHQSVTESQSAIQALEQFEANLKLSAEMISEILKESTDVNNVKHS